jgi:hypothetical protein
VSGENTIHDTQSGTEHLWKPVPPRREAAQPGDIRISAAMLAKSGGTAGPRITLP